MESSSDAPSSDPNLPILPVTIRDTIVDRNDSVEAAPSSVSSRTRRRGAVEFPTIDGPLGLSVEDSIGQARKFFQFGFLLLPWLWAVNCFYFWPVLSKPASHNHPQLRYYVVGSAIGFLVFSALLSSWAFTFAFGGEKLFGHVWDQLVMYNLADRFGLTGWV
ncbi:OLC1v1008614C3 [Oldenlandia corymbosa var. corymbosa]|uniref:OLC1v1008614C3 n=1 Tax=Oldenlandia corymbosa var. corymbosa TaxID=529605 RepID=A0AAV1DPI3_OLDCO|nr:OLC1v1008614C3 [Oldenlandia corymbosa var. corymbosa]